MAEEAIKQAELPALLCYELIRVAQLPPVQQPPTITWTTPSVNSPPVSISRQVSLNLTNLDQQQVVTCLPDEPIKTVCEFCSNSF